MNEAELKIKRLQNELRRYKKAYNYFMDYFDYLDEDFREELNQKLNTVDL
jgi:hypothetical protein